MVNHPSQEPKTIRCPYCVEGGQFKAMIGRLGGEWLTCAHCGHLSKPNNPHFKCTCVKCVQLATVESDSPKNLKAR